MALEATPVIKPKVSAVECGDQNIIQPSKSTQEGCDVSGRLDALTVEGGQSATLRITIRNDAGQPIDLISCGCPVDIVDITSSASSEASANSDDGAVDCPPCTPTLRLKEASLLSASDPIWEVPVSVIDSGAGVVEATLPAELTKCPAVYRADWAIKDDVGNIVLVYHSFVIVQASLFTSDEASMVSLGPPLLKEIRLRMRDSGPADNPLLQDVEFSDVEILDALVRPVREFHEQPPPLNHLFTTKTFPWKEMWARATVGFLNATAAAYYRRNQLKHSSGGISLDDKNKEAEYLRAAGIGLDDWKNFMQHKKVQLNAQAAMGMVGSTYGAFYTR